MRQLISHLFLSVKKYTTHFPSDRSQETEEVAGSNEAGEEGLGKKPC